MINATFILATIVYIGFNFAFAMAWNMVLFKGQYAELTGTATREKSIIPRPFGYCYSLDRLPTKEGLQ